MKETPMSETEKLNRVDHQPLVQPLRCAMGFHKWEESERIPEDPQAGLWKIKFTRTCLRCGKVRKLYQACGAIYER